ncbi:MAG: zinc-dependent alcohol dehydrogenase [Nocardioides sp.]
MRALVLDESLDLHLVDRDRPAIKAPTDVLVKVHQTGVCGTDRSILVGKFPAMSGVILGHEAVGTVSHVGHEVHDVAIGDRVVVNPTLYCGRCDRCRAGKMNFCLNKSGQEVGIDRDGSYADFVVLEDRFLHRIPADIGFDRAVVIEPLACVLNNLDAARIVPGGAVTVIGAGPIGVLCAMTARHLGGIVTVIERDRYRRNQAQVLLAGMFPDETRVISPDATNGLAQAQAVLDTVGNQLELAIALTSAGGTAVIMGYDSGVTSSIRPLDILQRGIRIVGAGDYMPQHFSRAIDLASHLPLELLVTHHFSLDQHANAFAALATNPTKEYNALKVVIRSVDETN